MTRRYTDTIIQELPNELPDNTGGDITPAVLRQMIDDVVQSLRPAFAGLGGSHAGAPLSISLNNTTWTPLVLPGLWKVGEASDIAELSFDLVTGSIVPKLSNYNHFIQGSISFEGPNGRLLDLSIGVNGSPVGAIGAIECLGNTTLQNFFTNVYIVPLQNAQVQLLGKWFGGAASDALKISYVQLFGQLITTRHP